MKNKILLIFLSAMLIMPISVLAVEDVLEPSSGEAVYTEDAGENYDRTTSKEIMDENQALLDEDKEQQNTFKYKEPISKRMLVKKFIKAMFLVVVFIIVIYLGLSVYNKLRNGSMVQVKTPEGETPLTAPKTTEDAVKTFLEKTNWR